MGGCSSLLCYYRNMIWKCKCNKDLGIVNQSVLHISPHNVHSSVTIVSNEIVNYISPTMLPCTVQCRLITSTLRYSIGQVGMQVGADIL